MSLKYQINQLEQFENAELNEIIGSVSTFPQEEEPFRGFLLRGMKIVYDVQLYCTPKPQKCSTIAKISKAFAVINGGFWTDAHTPLDWCVHEKQELTPLSNPNRPTIYFENTNICIDSADLQRCSNSLLQAGPLLLGHGQINTDYSDYSLRSDQFDSDITKKRYPRCVFGLDATAYYFLVIDGRSRTTGGLFLHELAELCRQLGMIDAINLDGGASTTLIINQRLINEPRFSFYRNNRFWSARIPGRERKVPNALILKKKQK